MNKHYITEEVLRLVRQAIKDNRGSKAAFCRLTGITQYNLSKLLNGKKKFVFGDDWNRLCDFIPEIDDRNLKIKGNCNAVNGNVVVGDNTNISNTDSSEVLSELIEEIIMLEIDPIAKDAVLKAITAFKARRQK